MLTLSDGRNELWQWDTGRTFVVGADCTQVHFSNKVFGRSIDVDVVDGIAVVPDILLQTDKDLTAWAFVGTTENGYTKISKTFKVNKRNKPADYVFTPPEQTTLEEIKEKLDYLESIQDPDAIKNAVDEYLQQNPVDFPVDSVNGKNGNVKLTADDVGAISQDKLQDATNVALAQAKESGEFDGKDGYTPRKGVDYFDGKDGKDGYTPVKGVDYWTPDDKQEIVNKFGAVSYNEQTLTEAQKSQARENIGAVSDEEWFEIADITSTEEVNSFYVNKDKNGNPFVCKRIMAIMILPSELVSGGDGVFFGGCDGLWGSPGFMVNNTKSYLARIYDISVTPGFFTEFRVAANIAKHFGGASYYGARDGEGYTDLLTQFFVCRVGTGELYPVGTQLKVWGLKE